MCNKCLYHSEETICPLCFNKLNINDKKIEKNEMEKQKEMEKEKEKENKLKLFSTELKQKFPDKSKLCRNILLQY